MSRRLVMSIWKEDDKYITKHIDDLWQMVEALVSIADNEMLLTSLMLAYECLVFMMGEDKAVSYFEELISDIRGRGKSVVRPSLTRKPKLN